MPDIEQKLKLLPNKPGVYLYKDAAGRVLYVGKAIDLKKRVSSYFKPASAYDQRIEKLVPAIRDIDFIITNNELEAIFLENTLIKKYRPRFNIMMRDDKGYPYLKLTDEEFPRLELSRRVREDGGRYFGPYTSAANVRGTIQFLQKVFPLRLCKKMNKNRKEPCMYYHIEKCGGACSGLVSAEDYAQNVEAVSLFLNGRRMEIIENLRAQMMRAASEKSFEKARIYRDRLAALEAVANRKQEVVIDDKVDIDVLGAATESGLACVEVMFIRDGNLTGHDPFVLRTGEAGNLSEIVEEFIQQYYAHRGGIPPEVIVSHAPDNISLMKEFLKDRAGRAVNIVAPKRGRKMNLSVMATKNAAQRLREEIDRDLHSKAQAEKLLAALRERLKTDDPLSRIVGFDISTTRGIDTVGSAVAFNDGTPDKAGYRKFIIKGSGADDFSSMTEMATRYFTRVLAEQWPAPDLLIVDGGKGQISAVERGLSDAGYDRPVIVMGFAKESFESYMIGRRNPIRFKQEEPAVHIVRRVIAEAHRFAITFHRKKRGARMLGE